MADAGQVLFTCLSCTIAFTSAEEQRIHYRSDHHRYNMKRRVAGLPPITAVLFNERVLERKTETAVTTSPKSLTCEICDKLYTTENSFRSHLQSKKHKDRELKGIQVKPSKPADEDQPTVKASKQLDAQTITEEERPNKASVEDNDDIEKTIEQKIAAARAQLSTLDCLFCPNTSDSFENNLTHMSIAHSFFIPDADYLTDIKGLITYLGEKIAVGNVCIFCNEKSRGFRTVDAVRKHMVDKSHCKIAYETEDDRLELSDYYDFSASYPDALVKEKRKKDRKPSEEWEDVDEEDDADDDELEGADEVVDASDSDSSDSDDLPDNQLTYGDSEFELVLPSGARIGHRSMRRYYAQSFTPVNRGNKPDDPNSGAALVRKLIADKNSALVPRKGGFGAFGSGTDVVKARNVGEAREAGRHIKEFRDQRRREEFKTKVGFRHNSQKHFRDPLLQ